MKTKAFSFILIPTIFLIPQLVFSQDVCKNLFSVQEVKPAAKLGFWQKAKSVLGIGSEANQFQSQRSQPQEALQFERNEPYYKIAGENQTQILKDPKTNIVWGKRPYSLADEGNEASVVIGANIAIYFGFPTSEPRVVQEGNSRFVLRLEKYGYKQPEQNAPGQMEAKQKRQLYLLSALVGKNLISEYNEGRELIFDFSKSLQHREFIFENGRETKLANELSPNENIQQIMESAGLKLQTGTSPWHQLDSVDVQEFLSRLRTMNTATIRTIVADAKLSDPAAADRYRRLIEARRDVMLSHLEGYLQSLNRVDSLRQAESTIDRILEAHYEFSLKMHEQEGTFDQKRAQFFSSLSEQDIHQFHFFIEGLASGKHLQFKNTARVLSFLISNDKFISKKLNPVILTQLFEKVIENLPLYGGSEVSKLFSLLITASFEQAEQGNFTFLQKILLAFRKAYLNGRGNLLAQLVSISSYSELPIKETFKTIKAAIEQGVIQNQDAELFLLGFINAQLNRAKLSDFYLSQGAGFHHAQDVNKFMNKSIEVIKEFRIYNFSQSSLTRHIQFETLISALNGLIYDSLGRRQFGDGVSPQQAFGYSKDPRNETSDPYKSVRNYLSGGNIPQLPGQ